MEFTKSLIKGKLIKRYKRFFVDVKINKEVVTAHCPNTGSMKGLLDEGNEVYLLKNDNPKRKLKYGLELIKANNNLVGVNTHMANKIVEHGLNANLINELKNNNLPYLVCITDPTAGGITASYAMLGDIHIAEPNALIGFAGPRVIENTIKENLPDGFQKSEYLLDHGMIDMVSHRKDLKNNITSILDILTNSENQKSASL